jgi:pectinesterase
VQVDHDTLVARKPIKGKQNTINAHGWEHATKTTGFMFQFCNVVARDDLVHANFPVETYLGRLRKVQAHVVFMECDLQSLVDPKGWLQWPDKTTPSICTLASTATLVPLQT